jgi:hypothetical protein
MPVVLVRSLRPPSPDRIDAMLEHVTQQVAAAIGTDVADVWAYWQEVGGVSMGAQAAAFEGHAPVVTILARTGRTREVIAVGLEAAAHAVSASLALPPEDVWAHWQEVASGHVFAGGRILD